MVKIFLKDKFKAIKPHKTGSGASGEKHKTPSHLSSICCIPFEGTHLMAFPLKMTLKHLKISLGFPKVCYINVVELINNNKTASQYLYYLFNCSINNNLGRGNKNIFEMIFYQKNRERKKFFMHIINLLSRTLRKSAAARRQKS